MKKYIFAAIVLAQLFTFQPAKAETGTSSGCTVSISANPTTIQSGQTSTLSWVSQGCLTVGVLESDTNPNEGVGTFSSDFANGQNTSAASGSISTGILTASSYFLVWGSSTANANLFTSDVVENNITVTVGSATLPAVPLASVGTTSHPNNTNVISNGTIYLITSGMREPYTSAADFLSYGLNSWATVQPANTADLALPIQSVTLPGTSTTRSFYVAPRNGSLINDNGTVYLITNGLRVGFSSAAVFTGLGYSFTNVASGDTSFLTALAPLNSSTIAHPDGTLINDNGTIYIMQNGYRMGIPSADVFKSWGMKSNEVVKANSYDKAAQQSGVLEMNTMNLLQI
jgi:hypothetical protein